MSLNYKCLSMEADLSTDVHPQDIRRNGNADFAVSSGTRFIKLFIDWHWLHGSVAGFNVAPTSWQQCFHQLNHSRGAAIQRLDQQIAYANARNLQVILTIQTRFPEWSSQRNRTNYAASGAGKDHRGALPDDTSASGPYGWFMSWLCARYKRGWALNPIGPHEPNYASQPEPAAPPPGYNPFTGNPYGAFADFIEVCNEPNLQAWPQYNIWCVIANFMTAAEQTAYFYGGPALLGPATLDTGWKGYATSENQATTTGWYWFTRQLLAALDNFRPRVYFAWSLHNYSDIRDADSHGGWDDTRVGRWRPDPDLSNGSAGVRQMLYHRQWQGAAGNRAIWITEGGYVLPQLGATDEYDDQERCVRKSFGYMKSGSDVTIFSQHKIHDSFGTDTWYSGLREPINPNGTLGVARPLWTTWSALA